jgi:hypothetical protein
MTPAVRAHVSQVLLRAGTERLSPDAIGALRIAMPPGAFEIVESSSAFAWIPLASHLLLVEGLRRALGDEEYRERMRLATTSLLEDAMLRGLVDAAVRHVGATPNGLLRFASAGFGATFRACGTLIHREIDRGRARVLLVGFPVDASVTGTFALGLAGSLDAVIELAGQVGRTSIVAEESSSERVTFELAWGPRGRPRVSAALGD